MAPIYSGRRRDALLSALRLNNLVNCPFLSQTWHWSFQKTLSLHSLKIPNTSFALFFVPLHSMGRDRLGNINRAEGPSSLRIGGLFRRYQLFHLLPFALLLATFASSCSNTFVTRLSVGQINTRLHARQCSDDPAFSIRFCIRQWILYLSLSAILRRTNL